MVVCALWIDEVRRARLDQEALSLARSVGGDLGRALCATESQWRENHDARELASAVIAAMDAALAALGASECWGPANRVASGEFWRVAEPWLRFGSLQVHARTKPRGYAGDFELLGKICDEMTCDHPMGKVMDRYFQDQAAPQAVRDRTKLLAGRLVAGWEAFTGDVFRVVSIGSGPARELQMAARQIGSEQRNRLHVVLLDLDPKALDHAARQLRPLLGPEGLTTIRANLSRLPQTARVAAEIAQADYLFSSGFFDYLEDRAAVDMLALFWHSLAPEGKFTVFNFSPDNTSRAYMEWIGNWYLTYRDETTLAQLARRSGIGERCVHVQRISRDTLVELTVERSGDCRTRQRQPGTS